MGKAIPSQHPTVVLRSQYRLVRALLAIAMIAVVGLTAAVVILANDTDEVSKSASPDATRSLTPEERATFGPSSVAPGTRYDGGPEGGARGIPLYEQQLRKFGFTPRQAAREAQPGTRYDGGPEEGTRGIPLYEQQLRKFGFTPRQAAREAQPGTRYDGGPEEGTRGIPLYEQQLRKFGFTPRQAAREAQPGTRYDGGPEEGTRGPGQ